MNFFCHKKYAVFVLIFLAGVCRTFAFGGVSCAIGSGYVFYGDSAVRARNKSLDDPSQIILNANVSYQLKIAKPVYFSLGCDTVFDARWAGDKHVFLLDYAGLVGFQVYPGLAGLMLTVDYALGRRTDFYDLTGNDAESSSTNWGNGFKCGIQYDFAYTSEHFAPIVGVSWRRMPRGNAADNILSVFFKLTIR